MCFLSYTSWYTLPVKKITNIILHVKKSNKKAISFQVVLSLRVSRHERKVLYRMKKMPNTILTFSTVGAAFVLIILDWDGHYNW